MTDIRLDWQRTQRTSVPEAVYCASKSIDQMREILRQADEADASLLLTRLSPDQYADLGIDLDYDPTSRTAIFDRGLPALQDKGAAIVAAGTSDAPVAHEARRDAGI